MWESRADMGVCPYKITLTIIICYILSRKMGEGEPSIYITDPLLIGEGIQRVRSQGQMWESRADMGVCPYKITSHQWINTIPSIVCCYHPVTPRP